jgi:metal-responsive CopG/Arc/MetJ family transcriptional regulator
MKIQNASFVRASISFPPGIYQSLETLAKQKKVSLAWVVREAAERYVADETAEGGRRQRQAGDATGKLTRRAT